MSILGITCQRDDGPFLAEWLAHHLAAGFDHFLVLSHECSDGSDAYLEALAKSGRVTHLPFQPSGKKSVQWQALQIASDHPLYKGSEWALFFDCDEFLVLPEMPLDQLLSQLEPFDAMALPWRLFGSNGQKTRSPEMTPARFNMAAPKDLHFPLGHLFKTLHRPSAFQKLGVHRPRRKKAKQTRWAGPDLNPLPTAFCDSDNAISLYGLPIEGHHAWLNHYSLRSTEEFLVKRDRGLPNHQNRDVGTTYWAERNWNVERSIEILPMLAATEKVLSELLSLPNARETYEACLDWHKTKYRDLMKDIDTVRLAFRLNMLSGSTPPSAEEGRAFLAAQARLLKNKASE